MMQTVALDYRVAYIPGLGYGWFAPESWAAVPLPMRQRVQVVGYCYDAATAARQVRELIGGVPTPAVTPWLCPYCGGEGKRIVRRAGPGMHLVSWLECRRCGARGDFRDSETALLRAGQREREE